MLSATGDDEFPVSADGLADFRIDPRIAGKSPLFYFGRGQSRLTVALDGANNVSGEVKGNSVIYRNAWNSADYEVVNGGHILRKAIHLRTGHPNKFSFILSQHDLLDLETLTTPDFRILQPVLEPPDVDMAVIPLKWLVSEQGGKVTLTVVLPVGDWDGWTLDPTLILQPDAAAGKDTYIRGGAYVDINYGTDGYIIVKYPDDPSYRRRGLLEFDLSSIPAEAICVSAILSLWTWPGGSLFTTGPQLIHSLTASRDGWTELGATWNKYDGIYNWAEAGAGSSGNDYEPGAIGSITVPLTINTEAQCSLTATRVQGWFGATNTNYGIRLHTSTTSDTQNEFWHSSDGSAAAYRPKLVVEYVLPGGGAPFNRPFAQPLRGAFG